MSLYLVLSLALLLPCPSLCQEYCPTPSSPWSLCNNPDQGSNLVAHPTDCQVFYTCLDLGTGQYGPVEIQCDDDLAFDSETGLCVEKGYIERCNCVERPSCPDGWVLGGKVGQESCYFLDRAKTKHFIDAERKCQDLGGNLVSIEDESEQEFVVLMAEEAATGNNDNLDYWIGGLETEEGWRWLSGAVVDSTGWWGEGPDGEWMGNLKGGCIQLLRKGGTMPGKLDTFYWARAADNPTCTQGDNDNGVICEMKI